MTIRLDDPRLAAEIRELVDRRIAYAMQHLAHDVRYGTVTAVDIGTQRASVAVGASPDASPGFVFPAYLTPSVGDAVRVVMRGADRYIEAVLSAEDPHPHPEPARIGRGVFHNATQSAPDATGTRLQYTAASWTDGITTHTLGSTVIAVAGMYVCTVHAEFTSSATGSWRYIGLGRAVGAHPAGPGGFVAASSNMYSVNFGTPNAGTIRHHAAWCVPLSEGDYVAGFVYQNSGAAMNIAYAEMNVCRVSA